LRGWFADGAGSVRTRFLTSILPFRPMHPAGISAVRSAREADRWLRRKAAIGEALLSICD
jgi:hypothetical protein